LIIADKIRRIVLQDFDDDNHKESQANIERSFCYCLKPLVISSCLYLICKS